MRARNAGGSGFDQGHGGRAVMSGHPCQGKNEKTLKHSRLLKAVRYDPETGYFYALERRPGARRGVPLGHVDINGYRRICIDGKKFLAHRLAWFYMTKKWPKCEIDHRDMKKDNNVWANLREATVSQNHGNMRPYKSLSGLKGAHWNQFRGCWQSYIKVDGISYFLGRFDTAQAAHNAYLKAAKSRFQGFARAA